MSQSLITTLPPFCPNCHKAFFWAGPVGQASKKQCHCKPGRKLFAEWMQNQLTQTENATNPTEIFEEPTNVTRDLQHHTESTEQVNNE